MLMMWSVLFCFFFFKQKTAYEMRISDWSSDVCSSDLLIQHTVPVEREGCIVGVHTKFRHTFPNRKTVEDEIARLIALLDALDGDPDLEECSDREQDDCDDPAWLERINQTGAPCPANMWWGYRDRKSTRLTPVTNAHLVF